MWQPGWNHLYVYVKQCQITSVKPLYEVKPIGVDAKSENVGMTQNSVKGQLGAK